MRKAAPIIACTPERWTKRARFALKRVRPLGLSRIGSKRNGSRSKSHECSAMLTVLKDAARRLCRWQVAILDHIRIRAHRKAVGTKGWPIQSNKGMAPKAQPCWTRSLPRSVRSSSSTRLLATVSGLPNEPGSPFKPLSRNQRRSAPIILTTN